MANALLLCVLFCAVNRKRGACVATTAALSLGYVAAYFFWPSTETPSISYSYDDDSTPTDGEPSAAPAADGWLAEVASLLASV